MPAEVQYGAMGILVLVLIAVGRLVQVFVLRALDEFRNVTTTFNTESQKSRDVFSATITAMQTQHSSSIDRINERHEEDHNRFLDQLGNLGARIESGRCVARPSAGQMPAAQEPPRGGYAVPEQRRKLPSRPDR